MRPLRTLLLLFVLAGCSGDRTSALVVAPVQPPTGSLALALHFDAPTPLRASAARRAPQYISGESKGLYISGSNGFPAVYADISGAPLCVAAAPPATGTACTVTVSPPPGKTYALTVVALDQKPTGENLATGYGTGFTSTANELSIGSTNATINAGSTNTVLVTLDPIATQFVAVDSSGNPTDGGMTHAADGVTLSANFLFVAGDAANNLVTCISLPCESFIGPENALHALTTTSSDPSDLNAGSKTTPSVSIANASNGSPPGAMQVSFTWDGVAGDDSCSGATPKCGVPIPISLANNIPASGVTPVIGNALGVYSKTIASAFTLDPFVVVPSCGAQTSCAATMTSTIAPASLALNAGYTASVTAYLFLSGGRVNLTGSSGCYASGSSCITSVGGGTAAVSCTSSVSPFGTVANIEAPVFHAGSATSSPPTADSATFSIAAAGAGTCLFQMQDSRTPTGLSPPVTINVSSSNATVGVPQCQQFGTPSGLIVVTPTSLSFTGSGQAALLTPSETGLCPAFNASSLNGAVASVSPASGTVFTVTAGSTTGNTLVTVTDNFGHFSNIPVSVTSSGVTVTIPTPASSPL